MLLLCVVVVSYVFYVMFVIIFDFVFGLFELGLLLGIMVGLVM